MGLRDAGVHAGSDHTVPPGHPREGSHRPGGTTQLSEAQFAEQIRELTKMLGLSVFHAYDSRRSWGPGFPDLVIAGRGGILYRELKTQRGKVTPHQSAWLTLLHAAGGDAGVWRPADLPQRIPAELRAITWKK